MKRPSLEQDLGEGFAQPVHRSFERWAARSPEAPAVSGAGRSLSYGELNRAANRLAHLLLRQSLGLEGVVGTLFPRVPESVVAALAVLKAGGAYLPLDPAYPDDRLLFTLADAGGFPRSQLAPSARVLRTAW